VSKSHIEWDGDSAYINHWLERSDSHAPKCIHMLLDRRDRKVFKRTKKRTLGVKEAMVKHVKLSKNPKVVRCKFFKRIWNISMIEEVKVKSCETTSVVGGKGEQQGSWWLNWHHHQFEVKVENCLMWLKISPCIKKRRKKL